MMDDSNDWLAQQLAKVTDGVTPQNVLERIEAAAVKAAYHSGRSDTLDFLRIWAIARTAQGLSWTAQEWHKVQSRLD